MSGIEQAMPAREGVEVPVLTPEDAAGCAALSAGLARAVEAGAAAVVIRLGGDPGAPGERTLSALCQQIEATSIPVIAALQGPVLGGWLGLALAAHLRIADAEAELGFPEVQSGLLPGAGATQRLPRLIGAAEALRMLLEGRPIGAAEALALGLIDGVVEEGLEAAAVALGREAAGDPLPTSARREGMRDPLVYEAAVARARRATAGPLPAPGRIVDCVEAALLLPLDQGLAFEAAALAELAESPEAAALGWLAGAARAPERRDAPAFATAGVLGAGEVAADWAFELLRAGLAVTLAGAEREALVAALERIAARQEAEVAAGRMTPEARDADWARLTPALGGAALAGLDLAFEAEAVPMVALLGEVPLLLHPGRGTLVELELPPGTPEAAVEALSGLLQAMGREVLRCAGAVGAPVLAAGAGAVAHLQARGVAGDALRAALARFGLQDLAGPGAGSQLPAAEIVGRVLGAMANAGAGMLAAGVVARPSEVDLALVRGQDFAAWEGGPMFWAERRGLMVLRRELRLWAEEAPELWQPAPLFDALIREGRPLASLNR